MLIYDPVFYAVSIPAVLLYGIAKGGFAGPLAILGVPLMSLVISPLQAAAILLPILCVQDMISIYSYRKSFHLRNLIISFFLKIQNWQMFHLQKDLFGEQFPALQVLGFTQEDCPLIFICFLRN